MLRGVDHFVIGVGAYIELIAFHEPYPEHRWLTALGRGGGPEHYAARFTGGPPGAALDPRVTHGAQLTFG